MWNFLWNVSCLSQVYISNTSTKYEIPLRIMYRQIPFRILGYLKDSASLSHFCFVIRFHFSFRRFHRSLKINDVNNNSLTFREKGSFSRQSRNRRGTSNIREISKSHCLHFITPSAISVVQTRPVQRLQTRLSINTEAKLERYAGVDKKFTQGFYAGFRSSPSFRRTKATARQKGGNETELRGGRTSEEDKEMAVLRTSDFLPVSRDRTHN